MDMRLAASSARRASYDNRTEPHTRASADNRIRIAAPTEAALGPTSAPLSLLPSPPSPRDFTRHAIPSNPRSDQERALGPTFTRAWEISRRPNRVRQLLGGSAESSAEQATLSRRTKCHTMQSNFPSTSLKKKESNPNKLTHFFGARPQQECSSPLQKRGRPALSLIHI